MENQELIDELVVWIKAEGIVIWPLQIAGTPNEKKHVRERLAKSLINHLCGTGWALSRPVLDAVAKATTDQVGAVRVGVKWYENLHQEVRDGDLVVSDDYGNIVALIKQ